MPYRHKIYYVNTTFIILVLFFLLIETSFIVFDYYRLKFTYRIKKYHHQIYLCLSSPAISSSPFRESCVEQLAQINLIRYIHLGKYKGLNDPSIILLGNNLQKLFLTQLILGICFIATFALLLVA
jgi:hypothetical protein